MPHVAFKKDSSGKVHGGFKNWSDGNARHAYWGAYASWATQILPHIEQTTLHQNWVTATNNFKAPAGGFFVYTWSGQFQTTFQIRRESQSSTALATQEIL